MTEWEDFPIQRFWSLLPVSSKEHDQKADVLTFLGGGGWGVWIRWQYCRNEKRERPGSPLLGHHGFKHSSNKYRTELKVTGFLQKSSGFCDNLRFHMLELTGEGPKDWKLSRSWNFQARLKISSALPTRPLFLWGILKVKILKFSSEIKNFKRDWKFQARLIFFNLWALEFTGEGVNLQKSGNFLWKSAFVAKKQNMWK